jgi:hypothetical protein
LKSLLELRQGGEMPMRLEIAILVLTLTAGTAALAADANDQANTFSPGSCETYLNARFEKKTIFFKGWLSGWISAHDRLMPDTYSLVVNDEQLDGPMQFMEDWCNDHPLEDFVAGAGALVDELYPKRQREAPAP